MTKSIEQLITFGARTKNEHHRQMTPEMAPEPSNTYPKTIQRKQRQIAKHIKLVKMCGPQHVDKNGIHNILTDARVLVFGIYVSILLLPCLWAGCLGLDVEKMMPTNEDLHSPLFYGSASLQPPPHQQKEGGNVTPHF